MSIKELTQWIVHSLHIPRKDWAPAQLLRGNLQALGISCQMSVFVYPEALAYTRLSVWLWQRPWATLEIGRWYHVMITLEDLETRVRHTYVTNPQLFLQTRGSVASLVGSTPWLLSHIISRRIKHCLHISTSTGQVETCSWSILDAALCTFSFYCNKLLT